MADPIRERIVQHCGTSLAAINGTGLYHHALAVAPIRGRATPEQLGTLPALAYMDGDEEASRVPNAKLSRVLTLTVEALVKVEGATLAQLATQANYLLADIERALTTAPTRGGLATSTTMVSNTILLDEPPGTLAKVTAVFAIAYRTVFGSPEQAG